MMEWLNHLAPAIQAITAVLIVVLTGSLIGVTMSYAATTRRIAQASVEQSEALQKPFVTIELSPRNGEDLILDEPNAAVVAQRPTLVLHNLGVGPALNVFCRIRQVDAPEGVAPLDHKEFIPSMRPRQKWATALPLTCLDIRNIEFSAKCRSLSGTEYETKISLENRVVKSFAFGRVAQTSFCDVCG